MVTNTAYPRKATAAERLLHAGLWTTSERCCWRQMRLIIGEHIRTGPAFNGAAWVDL